VCVFTGKKEFGFYREGDFRKKGDVLCGTSGVRRFSCIPWMGEIEIAAEMPTNPPPSPPIYLPFSAVEAPLQQEASCFVTSFGMMWWLQPFAPVTEAGWNETLRCVGPITPNKYSEIVDYVLPSGVQDVLIPFAVEKISPVVMLTGPMIINVIDDPSDLLVGLSFTLTNISTSSLSIQMNAILPSGSGPDPSLSNYRWRSLVTVVG